MTAHAPLPLGSADGLLGRRPRNILPTLLLALATLALLVPFLNKPFHLDDPVFLWVAGQVRQHPLDPYGFDANWYGVAKPMHDMNKNPPLVGYYIAAVDATVGRSERALHAAFLLPAIAVVLGTYFLARELGVGERAAMLASLLTLLTPVFLISASTVMLDVMMLAWWVWAVWAWVRGMNRDRASWLWLSMAWVAAAAMTKYFGAALIPLLLAYGLTRRGPRPRSWMFPLLLPLVVLAAYQMITARLYGRGLLLDAGGFAAISRTNEGAPLSQRLLTGLSFAGGGCITAAFAAFALSRAKAQWLALLALAIAMTLLVAWDPYPRFPLRLPAGGVNVLYWAQLGLFVTAGAGLLVMAMAPVRRDDACAVLLVLWLLGTIAFAAVLNWTVNGRSVLAAAPAVAIVTARIFESARLSRARMTALSVILIGGAVLSFLCVRADAAHALAARRAADELPARFAGRPRPLFFLGHWGFQYYIQANGARPLDPLANEIRGGDLIAVPLNNAYAIDVAPAAPNALPVVATFETPTLSYLANMDRTVAAGFYSDAWGPLPYAFGRVPPDRYLVKRIDGPIQPVSRP